MANRVTAAEVAEIYEYDSDITSTEIDIFITSANILTNKVNTVGEITATTQLKEIERWLAAHFVCIRDPQAASEKAGPVSQKLQEKVALNFNQTRYGQQALILDTSGYLASLQKSAEDGGLKLASIHAIDF